MEDEYELAPHNELEELRKEIDEIKKNPLGKGRSSESLLGAIKELNSGINRLVEIFRGAFESMEKGEESEEVKEIEPLKERIASLVEQNKKLADSISQLNSMIKELKEARNAPKPQGFGGQGGFAQPAQQQGQPMPFESGGLSPMSPPNMSNMNMAPPPATGGAPPQGLQGNPPQPPLKPGTLEREPPPPDSSVKKGFFPK